MSSEKKLSIHISSTECSKLSCRAARGCLGYWRREASGYCPHVNERCTSEGETEVKEEPRGVWGSSCIWDRPWGEGRLGRLRVFACVLTE